MSCRVEPRNSTRNRISGSGGIVHTHATDEAAFLGNSLVQDAVIRNLEIIGEASNNIQKRHPKFAEAHPELPLAIAYQMRNVVAHGYFKVDMEIVWKTIQRQLPTLYQQVRRAIEDLPSLG
ncbi:MAG TPA: HepT-like ribonuclease domain-containing protein [Rhodanobacteraceae bacterium]